MQKKRGDPQVVQLTQLARQTLFWVGRYPFVSADDLALLLPSWKLPSIFRALARLREYGLIEQIPSPLSGNGRELLYSVSNRGLSSLASMQGMSPEKLASAWGTDEDKLLHLLAQLPQLRDHHAFVRGLIREAPSQLTYQGARSEVGWFWMREYRQPFQIGERITSVLLDGMLLLRVRPKIPPGLSRLTAEQAHQEILRLERWYCIFFLMDAPLLPASLIGSTLRRLSIWQESRDPRLPCPLILLLLKDEARVALWQQCQRRLETLLPMGIALIPQGSVSERRCDIAPWLLTYQSAFGGNARLHDLLSPLPREAIPKALWHALWAMGGKSEKEDGRSELITISEKENGDQDESSQVAPLSRLPQEPHEGRRQEKIWGREQTVIVGQFHERAERLFSHGEEADLGHFGHVLLGIVLSRRHLTILHLLGLHPFLHEKELAAFLGKINVSSIKRYITLLKQWGCVEQAERLLLWQHLPSPEKAQLKERWTLSERGLRYFANAYHLSANTLGKSWTPPGEKTEILVGQEILQLASNQELERLFGLYHFFRCLQERKGAKSSPAQEQGRLAWWGRGLQYPLWFQEQGSWLMFCPTAQGCYQLGSEQIWFWLEYERRSKAPTTQKQRVLTYRRFVLSGAWAKHQFRLPLLLWVVPSKKQEESLAQVAAQCFEEVIGFFLYTTTIPRLRESGPHASIWRPLPSTPMTVPAKERDEGRVTVFRPARRFHYD